ncbi:hypothetical protein [Micromonospora sp. NPDC005413]|uniref:hypothetical protein n=1 Tax=Micromonospora sp. NPDC005413 TaxID=3154563 RepID=UPI0033ADD9B1
MTPPTAIPPASRTAGPVATAVERATAALSRMRRGRLLHPAGRSFAGEVLIWGTPGPPTGVALLDDPGRYRATVRLSVSLGRSLTTVAAATRTDTPRLVLAVASAVGPWRPVGRVSIGAQLSAEEDAALAFDPVRNLPPELRATGPLAWLREQTYRGSRRARGATAQSGGSTATTV